MVMESKDNLRISVIIPVYNVEKYICKCLDSIVNQTYQNLQVILVDDGTKDASGDICEEYAKKYDIFEVYHKQNEGLALTRNYGMQYIKGDYFAFVDSDDWLDNNYFEICARYLQKSNADIALVPFVKEYMGNPVKNDLFTSIGKSHILFDEAGTKLILRRLVGEVGSELSHPAKIEDYNTAWGKLFKTSKFRQLRTDEGKRSEDLVFNVRCFLIANSAEYIGETYYHYNRQNENSIVSNINAELLTQFKALYQELRKVIQDNNLGLEYEKALNNRIILNLITVAINYCTMGNLKLSKRLKILKEVLSDQLYIDAFKKFDFSRLPKNYKIFYTLCKKQSVFLLYVMTNIAMKRKDKIGR